MSLWLIVVTAMVLAIPLAAILGGVLIAIVKILKGDRAAAGQRLDAEEARMMQEIYQGLEKMEKRIEALETILLDDERKDEK